jgi:hypothetical protein
MPELSRFFGIAVHMHCDDHNPPHVHVEYQDDRALLDSRGNVLRGELESRTALRLAREWIDLHVVELEQDWALALAGREVNKIEPLR